MIPGPSSAAHGSIFRTLNERIPGELPSTGAPPRWGQELARNHESEPLEERWQTADDSFGDRPGIVASLWRYRLVVVAATVLAAVAGLFGARLLPVQYDATATLILRDPGTPSFLGGSSQNVDLQVYVAKQADIMTSTAVLTSALRQLNSHQPLADVRKALLVQPSKDLASVSVRASASSADAAVALANAVGQAYSQVTAQHAADDANRAITGIEKLRRQLQAEADALPKTSTGGPTARAQELNGRINDLQQRQQDIMTQAAAYASGVELFDPAERPKAPTNPKPTLDALLGALLGLIGASGWAWWAAARFQRAEQRDDPAAILRAPLLGEVPRFRVPRTAGNGTIPPLSSLDPTVAEAYHFIAVSLELELERIGGSSVVVTSVAPGDGKTSTAINIAIAAQQERRRVVLIDADERTQRLSKLCGVGQGPRDGHGADGERRESGPPRLGGDQDEFDTKEVFYRLTFTHTGMVLPIPRSDEPADQPSRFFRAPAFRKALLTLEEHADLVLIDTPALLAVSDAITIAGPADGIVLVVNRGVPLNQLRAIRDRLAFVNVPLIGYVFNRGSTAPGPYAPAYVPASGATSANGTPNAPPKAPERASPDNER
jgi:Mrp family chromosome partitioning ATPase/LPS O-antigen subunit length determinant protein (WzzB/FepE family)